MDTHITISHLTPYLPYDVLIYRENFHVLKIPFPIMNGHGGTHYEAMYNVINYQMKPLLLPLSELTEQMANDCGFPGNDGISVLIKYIKSRDISVKIWDDLVKNHWDVFSLISQNLAIDKRTIK